MDKINLGDRVQDKITGIKGIVVARTEWLFGCVRITLQPEKSKEGKPADNYTIDEPQAKIITKKAIPIAEEKIEKISKHGGREDVSKRVNII